MKLLITGATGSVGRHPVPQALERGHHVTVFVRSPRKIDVNHPRLAALAGDPLDAGALEKALVWSPQRSCSRPRGVKPWRNVHVSQLSGRRLQRRGFRA